MSHTETLLYASSQRKFIVNCSEFETPELFAGDSFKWKFQTAGRYTLRCPLYSWMKCYIRIIAYENPQDPDLVVNKNAVKVQMKNKSTQSHSKKTVKAPSIASSVASEEEISEAVNDEGIDQEIEKLFLQVKEECEKDRVGPANFLQEIEEEGYESLDKNFSGLIKKITEQGDKDFGKSSRFLKNKNKNKEKKAEKNLRRKMRTNKFWAFSTLRTIVGLKDSKESTEKRLEKLKFSASPGIQKKIEEYWRKGESSLDEYFLKRLACNLFGLNDLWWAEEILKQGNGFGNFESSLNEKEVERFLIDSKI